MAFAKQSEGGIPEGKQIFSLLPLVMRDLGAIKKDRKNPSKNYKFRGIDELLNNLHPVLIKHNITPSQQTTNLRTETIEEQATGGPSKTKRIYRSFLELTVTFHAPDGSSVSNTAAGEGIDYNDDKATSKAMSAAYKYAVYLGLCIPSEDGELSDSDSSSSPGGASSQSENSGATMINSPAVEAANAAYSKPVEAAPAANGSASLNTANGSQPAVMTDNSPCHQGQQDDIIGLVSRIGEAKNWKPEQNIEWLRALLAKKGKTRRSELTYAEAESLLAFLKSNLTKAEAEQLFNDTNAKAETATA